MLAFRYYITFMYQQQQQQQNEHAKKDCRCLYTSVETKEYMYEYVYILENVVIFEIWYWNGFESVMQKTAFSHSFACERWRVWAKEEMMRLHKMMAEKEQQQQQQIRYKHRSKKTREKKQDIMPWLRQNPTNAWYWCYNASVHSIHLSLLLMLMLMLILKHIFSFFSSSIA